MNKRSAFAAAFLLAMSVAALAPAPSSAADLQVDRIRGNFVYLDTHGKRIVEAVGPDVFRYVTDCVAEPVDATSTEYDPRWTITRVEAGGGESTFAPVDGVGGACQITTDANENDGINAQLRGESFKLTSTTAAVYFGIRLKLSEATQSDFFAGLAITDTDILGGVTDRIGFEKLDGVTAVKFMLEKNSTETLSASVLTADTSYHVLEWYFNGTNVEVFVDGVSVATPAVTNLPGDEDLRVTLQGLAGSAAARTFDVDWIRVYQIGE